MYLGTRKIFNPEQSEANREKVIREKSGAVWNAFVELEGLINKTQIAEQYFGRSQAWFSQKLNGCTLHNKRQAFSEEEYRKLAESFRHIALRLSAHADEIDAATMELPQEDL
ncbi:MAG: DUF5053 domain-containing protein [Bacteroidales bacterium]|nr:DUF5053 domain-containing protein [Bacteroidales bacterium]